MTTSETQNKAIELLNPWWNDGKVELGIERTDYLTTVLDVLTRQKKILFVVGSRRVGKTRLLLQAVYKLIKSGESPRDILFLSLDNSNLENLDWYSYIVEKGFKYVFLDEIHFSSDWSRRLKSLFDLPATDMGIVCSGSSNQAIEDKKAYLTGRSTKLQMRPLDYPEFKRFAPDNSRLNNYLRLGGYPEHVIERDPNYLNELLRDIVDKDIVKLHKLKNRQYLFDICQILAKQIGYKSSASKMANVLGLDNKTVENYIQYLMEVNLIDRVYQYSDSLNRKLYSPKKYYFQDLGMRNSFVGYSDMGSLAENAVFLNLVKLWGKENVHYLSDLRGNEIDFVVTLPDQSVILIESKYNNLESAVINSLNNLIYKPVHDKRVIKRLVITNGINTTFSRGSIEICLMDLGKFLEEGLMKSMLS